MSQRISLKRDGGSFRMSKTKDGAKMSTAATSSAPQRRSLVSLVVPARNEAGSIGWVLSHVPPIVDEVILVDSSTDDTVEIARSARPDIVVLNESRPGKGAALRAGFEAASCPYVVMIDADGSMNPLEIPRYVSLLQDQYDVVKGSRNIEGGGSSDLTFVRAVGNSALRSVSNLLYGARFTDLCYGFMGFRKEAIAAIMPSVDGFDIEAQLIMRAKRLGLSITEVPTFESQRIAGASKLHPVRDGIRVLRTILRERVSRIEVLTQATAVHELAASVRVAAADRPAATDPAILTPDAVATTSGAAG